MAHVEHFSGTGGWGVGWKLTCTKSGQSCNGRCVSPGLQSHLWVSCDVGSFAPISKGSPAKETGIQMMQLLFLLLSDAHNLSSPLIFSASLCLYPTIILSVNKGRKCSLSLSYKKCFRVVVLRTTNISVINELVRNANESETLG